MDLMKTIIFDMDGVIFDSERAVYNGWKEIADKYGFGDIDRAYFRCIGTNAARSKEIFLECFGEDFPYDKYKDEQSREYHRKYDGGKLPLKNGIKELMEALRAAGYKTAIASSTRTKVIEDQIRDAGLSQFFDVIVGGDTVERSKPFPDIFLIAAENLGAAPESTYVVEDSFNGIRAAHTGGFIPLMVPDMVPPDDEMRKKAQLIADDLFALKRYLGL